MYDEAVELQQKVEAETIERGIKQYQERMTAKVKREGFDKHDEVQQIIRGAVPILAEGIRAWVDAAAQAKGRKSTGYTALASLDADVVAAIGTTAIFGTLGRGGAVAEITENIGRRIEIELEAKALEAKDPKEAQKLLKLAEGKLSPTAAAERLRRLVEEREAALCWSRKTLVLVGQTVLNVALVKLEDLFVSKTIKQQGNRLAVVELTDEAAAAIVEMEDTAALKHLPLRPMVSPPRKWQHMTSGAYYDYRLSRLVPMVRVKGKQQREMIREAIHSGQMDEVLTALNAIQDTRWAIDERVLRWVLWARREGLRPSASFPASEYPDVPPKVEEEAWAAMDQEERSARSRKRRSIKLMRKAIGVDNSTFLLDMAEAEHLANYHAFFLPHSLDFRGRTYAVPYFNHQRSDHMKALFRFADAVPLGEHGGKWLMIHLANCGDFEKVSKEDFATRVAWVKDHEAMILATARNPDAFVRWWGEADEPFCFLQACFEYAEWMESGFSPDFLSTIPGAADGSCSGLQHYACITRSKEEAYHVNLLPRDKPGDIYKVTANVALPTLRAAASGGDKAAALILSNGFGRSEVKRNVMTYFYGSARFGMRDQHMQDLMRPLADKVAMGELEAHPYSMITERENKETGEITRAPDGGYTCAATMAAHVYQAVTTVARKADQAADWIQKVAAVLAHEGQSLVWVTQTGFPVVQRYSEYITKEVNLWLYDRSIRVPSVTDRVDAEGNVLARVRVLIRQAPTARVDKKAMRNASSPNVIHSMDAAHLHRSVARAAAEGIEHFAMIHDSFGTHLGNMERFGEIIREALVDCYRDYCPLAEIDQYARGVLSAEGIKKLPAIPPRGEMDLEDIKRSRYAFA